MKLKKLYPLAVMAALALSLFASCDDKEEFNKTTVYEFGRLNIDNLNIEQIGRSADSVQVSTIIFRVIPEANWSGANMYVVYQYLKEYFEAAKGKGKAEGTFMNVNNNLQYADSVASLGYGIELYIP
ncbi:MAG: hypothetical protein J1E38_01105 [Paramuribaculum sp.]|nr:hypothetical protein [Paramuribaculum sp.]